MNPRCCFRFFQLPGTIRSSIVIDWIWSRRRTAPWCFGPLIALGGQAVSFLSLPASWSPGRAASRCTTTFGRADSHNEVTAPCCRRAWYFRHPSPFRRRMPHCDVRVRHRVEPVAQLRARVAEVAEGAGQEEVLAYLAKRPLDLALPLGSIELARLRVEAVVAGEVDERTVVDDPSGLAFSDDGGLHATAPLPRTVARAAQCQRLRTSARHFTRSARQNQRRKRTQKWRECGGKVIVCKS